MKSILAFISLLMQVWAVAQLPISFKNTSLIQGLSQSSVVDIAFDEKGFVWLATQDGLNRFDGKDFFVVDKKFDDNTSGSFARLGKVVIGNHPNVWIISKGGQLEKFNLIHHSFEKVAIYVGNARQNITCLLAEENGMLWIGTENGKLLFFDSKSNKVVRELTLSGSAFTTINSLFKDRQHRIWVIGNKVGFIQNNEIVFEKIFSKSLKPEMLFADMTEDNSGNVWLGSLGQGLFVKRGAGAFQQYESGSNDLVIEDLLADDEGKIWIGTYGKGLFVIDPIQNSSRQFLHDKKNPFSLPFNDVLSIKQDKEKGIWIGTDGGGVSYYHKRQNNFMLFSNQTVPYSIEIAMVRSVTTDKQGVIWAGTSNKGLTKIDYERGEFKTWQFPSYKKNITNPGRIVSLLADNKGLIWCGTQGNGVLLFSPQIETVVEWFHPEAKGNYAIPDPIAWCIYATSEKEIWIGTESKGLCLIDREKGFVNAFLPPGKYGVVDAVRTITQVNDSILCIGFGRNPLQFFNTYTKTFSPARSKELENLYKEGLTVKSLYYKKPNIWIGTDGKGLIGFNLPTGKCKVLTEKEGLPNNTVYGILPDDNEHLWISTNRGLSTFHTSVLDKQPQPTHFSNFTAPQGLQSNEFNTGAYHRAADGRLLFGGIGGLNVFDPLKFSGESTPIAVVFTKVVVDNETIPADSSATYKKTITLTYKDHSVGFSFAALDFTAMGQNHFYYQLEGYDKDWIDGEQRNYVSYTNIPAGQYTFRVKYAKDRYSNDVPVSQMQVIIQAPFWEKTWFVTLMIMIALGMIYGLYRYRITQVFRLVQIRQSIANNLHDDIGSTLSNINILSELSKKSLQKPAQAHTFLDRISEEVQTSSQSLDDIIWSVNTRNDTWPETFSRMRRYASEVFENSSTVYTIELQEQPGMVRLNMEKRRDVFLIYKELLNNIHKHAAATKVEIFMRFRQGQLVMKISDNGNGFDKTAQTHRNGLKSLSSRVDRWKGKFDIKTGAGGTTIEILL